jgi:hypothetical protein
MRPFAARREKAPSTLPCARRIGVNDHDCEKSMASPATMSVAPSASTLSKNRNKCRSLATKMSVIDPSPRWMSEMM